MNIWTEIFPCICFIAYSIDYMLNDELIVNAPTMDKVIIAIGLFGALVLRPLLSAGAHTLFNRLVHITMFCGGVLIIFSICITIVCSSLVYSFYILLSATTIYVCVINAVGLLISTLLAVIMSVSPGVRVGSFLLLILLANVMPLT